jgi:competence ComEA-like helix-hairpin-helix protein
MLRRPKATLLSAAWALLLSTGAAMAQNEGAPAADKRHAVFQKICSTCHPMDKITARRSRSQWEDVLYKMIDLGAKGTDQEFRTILDYLTSEYGRVNVNRGPAGELSAVLGLTKQQASAIVAHRREHRKFENFDALAQMPGIDVGQLEKLRDAISY